MTGMTQRFCLSSRSWCAHRERYVIVVIQCAARKRPDAGYMTTSEGTRVLFVAKPALAPPSSDVVYARPDDVSGDGRTWRDLLVQYNEQRADNPLGLARAVDLYQNRTYRLLAERYGIKKPTSSRRAGVDRADFLTPVYDITYSQSGDSYKRRRKSDRYDDLRMIPEGTEEPVFFFGGSGYLRLFVELTESVKGPRTVFFNSANPPDVTPCRLERFHTNTRTNWHYECAQAFVAGRIQYSTNVESHQETKSVSNVDPRPEQPLTTADDNPSVCK